jgi:hypothetical protein
LIDPFSRRHSWWGSDRLYADAIADWTEAKTIIIQLGIRLIFL